MKRRQVLILWLAGAAALGLGSAWFLGRRASPPPPLPALVLPDLAGTPHGLDHWRGKVLVLNFWGTWCAPCLKEVPEFVRLQSEYGERGLQFVGVAIDDPEVVAAFAEEHGINYPLLTGERFTAVRWMEQAGNRTGVLPFTVLFDRNGAPVQTHLGPLAREVLLEMVMPLL